MLAINPPILQWRTEGGGCNLLNKGFF